MNDSLTASAVALSARRQRNFDAVEEPSDLPKSDPAWTGLADRLAALAAGEDLIARMRLAMIRLTRQLRRADPAGLSVAAISALTTIALGGQMTLGELAEAERLQSPSVTRIVDRLEEAGLVRRVPCQADRRIVRAVATEAGHRLLEERWFEGHAFLAQRVEALHPSVRSALPGAVELLEALVAEARPDDLLN
jgi:DNA-binding MarR family transcriptional regulator